MATFVGIGFSSELNTPLAAREATLQAKTRLANHEANLLLVFATSHYSSLEVLSVAHQTFPAAKIVGCLSSGIILSENTFLRGIGLLAISSKEMKFGTGFVSDITFVDPRLAGAELARTTAADFGVGRRAALMIFADSLLKNYDLLAKGAQETLGKAFPIMGAASAHNVKNQESYQFFQDKPLTSSATALLIGGQATVASASRHGWKPLGKPRIADRTQSSMITSIDGTRASFIYEDYLDVASKEISSPEIIKTASLYPLGFYVEELKDYILRYPVEILENGNIICRGEVPEGAEIHLMISSKDLCKQTAVESAEEVKNSLAGKKPSCLLVFESLNRQKLLGRNTIDEIRAVKNIFGENIPIFGMYSSGEFAPLKSAAANPQTYWQNNSFVILAITS